MAWCFVQRVPTRRFAVWSTHGIGVVDQSLDDEYSPADCSL